MKTLLVGLNPDGIVGMAPYYLKSYYVGKFDSSQSSNIAITGYDVNTECDIAVDAITRQAPDLLAFSCYVWNMEQVLSICDTLRKQLPHMLILLCGPEVSPRAKSLLENHSCIDIVAV